MKKCKKKFKTTRKFLALLLGMVLMAGATVSVSADGGVPEAGNLQINNLPSTETVTVNAYQVVEFNDTLGWQLTEWAKTALGANTEAALTALTTTGNSNSSNISGYLTTLAAASGKEQAATGTTAEGGTSVTLETTALGSYLVICSSNGYTYTNMLVSNYDVNGQGNNVLKVGTANAKGVPKKIIDEKTVGDGQGYVAVGDIIDYKVSGNFPYFQGYDQPNFVITDTMSKGLVLKMAGTELAAGDFTIKVAADESGLATATPLTDAAYTVAGGTADTDGKTTYTITFKQDWLKANAATYGGGKFTIEYQGEVTEYVATNTYKNQVNSTIATDGGGDKTPDTPVEVESYTAALELTKQGENNAKLAGAEFILKMNGSGKENDGKYVKIVDGKVTAVEETDAGTFTTTDGGTVSISGLDPDYTYTLKETKAPAGYALEGTEATVTFTADGTNKNTYTASIAAGAGTAWINGNGTNAAVKVGVTLTDTKLGALPETGGIGVMILTLLGAVVFAGFGSVLIMMKKKRV